MAINFIKKPYGVYPVYNDSYLEFKSTLRNVKGCSIDVYLGKKSIKGLLIYPDIEGFFLLNIGKVVLSLMEKGFRDDYEEGFYGGVYGFYYEVKLDLVIFDNNGVEDRVSEVFEFNKSCVQVGGKVSYGKSLMSYRGEGIDYYMTYFEGFPFSFGLDKLEKGSVVELINVNTRKKVSDIRVVGSGVFRFGVDDGVDNWTNSGFLSLTDGLNVLELADKSGVFANIFLKKRRSGSGVLLKWFNSEGYFSYYLFDKFFETKVKSSLDGVVYDSDFNNINDSSGYYLSTGKSSSKQINLKANIDEKEFDVVEGVLNSPYVQMYTSQKAFVKGRFVNVVVSGTAIRRTKKRNNKIGIVVNLPETVTAKM